jgi:hypothetical protein
VSNQTAPEAAAAARAKNAATIVNFMIPCLLCIYLGLVLSKYSAADLGLNKLDLPKHALLGEPEEILVPHTAIDRSSYRVSNCSSTRCSVRTIPHTAC